MVYVVAVRRSGKDSTIISIPKAWVKDNIDVRSKIMYLVTKGIGVLELHTERSWFEKYFSKGGNGVNQGTAERGEGSNGQGLTGGISGEPEDEGTPPADNTIIRA